PKGEGADGGAAAHEFAGVDRDFTTVADDDHAAAAGQKFCIVGQVHIGEHFENDVHTAAAGGLQYPLLITRLAVIENLMRALAFYEVDTDRKSTRLNSSHVAISYAVF